MRHSLTAAVLGAVSLLLRCAEPPAPTPPPAAEVRPRAGGTLVIGVRGEFGSLNPYTAEDDATLRVLELIYPKLFHERFAGEGEQFEPAAVERYTVDRDGGGVTLHLRTTQRWSDGARLACDDLAFTFASRSDPTLGWSGADAARQVVLLDCTDPSVAQIRFRTPAWNNWFALNDGALLPARYAAISRGTWRDRDWSQASITSGPYRLASVVPGQELVLIRNPEWWDAPRPYIERIVLRIYADEAQAVVALRAGEIDLLDRIPAAAVDTLRNDPALRLHEVPALSETQITFNQLAPDSYVADRRRRGCDAHAGCVETVEDLARLQRSAPHPVLTDVAVRQALSAALDAPDLIDGLYGGRASAGDTPLLSSLWAHDGAAAPAYDPRGARQLLDAAGWIDPDGDGSATRVRAVDGRPLTVALLVNAESASKRDLAQRCVAMWRLIGVDAHLEAVPRGEFAQRARDKRFDALLIGMRIGTALDLGLHSRDALDRGLNMGAFLDPESDRLLQRAAGATTREAARELWRAWQHLVRQERPVRVLLEERTVLALSSRVQGATPSALDPYDNLPRWWLASP